MTTKPIATRIAELEAQLEAERTERDRRIRSAVASGHSYREAAEIYGVSYQRVAQLVKGKGTK